MAATVVGICNRALQKLGASKIVSISESSRNAIACNLAYEPCRDALLEMRVWGFAIKTVQLAADAVAPTVGRGASYTLPGDFIRLADPYPEDNLNTHDWEIEDGKIFTDDTAPITLRYVCRVTDPAKMTSLFRELLSTKMGFEMCEELTQSNTKKAALAEDLDRAFKEAARSNAIQKVAAQPPEDEWVTVRS